MLGQVEHDAGHGHGVDQRLLVECPMPISAVPPPRTAPTISAANFKPKKMLTADSLRKPAWPVCSSACRLSARSSAAAARPGAGEALASTSWSWPSTSWSAAVLSRRRVLRILEFVEPFFRPRLARWPSCPAATRRPRQRRRTGPAATAGPGDNSASRVCIDQSGVRADMPRVVQTLMLMILRITKRAQQSA